MRKVSESVEEMLLDYLDGNLAKADKEKVEKNLQEVPAWRARYEELRSLNSVLAESIIEQPSKNFTASVVFHYGTQCFYWRAFWLLLVLRLFYWPAGFMTIQILALT
jgi:anti-sigma factor RsiW